MRVLQVCPYFHPYLAGQERYVLQLSKKLVKYGVSVDVFTTNHSHLPNFEVIEGINVHRFKMIVSPLNNPISVKILNIFKYLKSYDVLHIHNEHSFVSLIVSLYDIVYKKPIILTCHGQLKFGSFYKNLFEKIYSITFGKFIFTTANKIIALSEDDKEYICKLGIDKNKILVLPNAIDTEYLDNFYLEANNKLKEEFQDKKVILYVGRLIPRKGVDYLIKSVKEVVEKHDNSIFILIGEGDSKECLEKMCDELNIKEHVVFLSNLSDDSLFKYYQIADIFILPSLSEGLPTTILEAMYFGAPVITTDIPGIRNHFKNVSLLIPPENDSEISKSIIKLLEDEKLCSTLSSKGRHHVTNYTWNQISKSYLNIYSELVIDSIPKSTHKPEIHDSSIGH